MTHNPYTCRLLIRIDKLLYRMRGIKAHWSKSGKLVIGHCEAQTHFPGWMFCLASRVQNKWFWTRNILSS